MTVDPDQVRAAVAGDPRALNSVFERSMAPLVAFIRGKLGARLATRESATDLAQSVYREVIVDFDALDYRGEEEFRSWLFQQAVRKILDRNRFHRRERRDIARDVGQEARDDDLGALARCYATLATPSRHAAAREDVAKFEAAIAELPDAQRDAVTMSRLMGLGYPEIADVMESSESSVRGLVARGLATLSARLTSE